MFEVLLISVVLTLIGIAAGMRPASRPSTNRSWGLQVACTTIVATAAWMFLSPEWAACYRAWVTDDPKLLGYYLVLASILYLGIMVLAPLWGYTIARSATNRLSYGKLPRDPGM